jgi:hypothetical protein
MSDSDATSSVAEARQALQHWQTPGAIDVLMLSPLGRSGSLLIQSLLDDHPAVATFSHWFEVGYDDLGPSSPQTGNEAARSCAVAMVERCRGLFTGYYYGDASFLSRGGALTSGLTTLDAGRFIDAVVAILGETSFDRRRFFLAAYAAMRLLRGLGCHDVRWLVYHNHYLKLPEGSSLLRDFPSLRAIVTTRDPRESMLSFRRLEIEIANSKHVFAQGLARLKVDAALLVRAARLWSVLPAERLRIVDLNGLHAHGSEAIDALASWLAIERTPGLELSTVYGTPWSGNAVDGTPRRGLDDRFAALRWPTALPSTWLALTETLLRAHVTRFGYTPPSVRLRRAELRRTILLHDPYPALFARTAYDPVFGGIRSPRDVIDEALHTPGTTKLDATPLLGRALRVARALRRYTRLFVSPRLAQVRERYRLGELAVFEEADAAIEGAPPPHEAFLCPVAQACL